MRATFAPVYGWFPEGFDTADLRELLDEISVDFRSWAKERRIWEGQRMTALPRYSDIDRLVRVLGHSTGPAPSAACLVQLVDPLRAGIAPDDLARPHGARSAPQAPRRGLATLLIHPVTARASFDAVEPAQPERLGLQAGVFPVFERPSS